MTTGLNNWFPKKSIEIGADNETSRSKVQKAHTHTYTPTGTRTSAVVVFHLQSHYETSNNPCLLVCAYVCVHAKIYMVNVWVHLNFAINLHSPVISTEIRIVFICIKCALSRPCDCKILYDKLNIICVIWRLPIAIYLDSPEEIKAIQQTNVYKIRPRIDRLFNLWFGIHSFLSVSHTNTRILIVIVNRPLDNIVYDCDCDFIRCHSTYVLNHSINQFSLFAHSFEVIVHCNLTENSYNKIYSVSARLC